MQKLTGQIPAIQTTIQGILEACKLANDTSSALQDADTDLPTLEQLFEQLVDVMNRIESDTQASSDTRSGDITEIGEYALRLQETLSGIAEKLGLTEQQQPLATLTINLAVWIARHKGQIETLEPAVDALALLANTTQKPRLLEQLSDIIKQIIEAVSTTISQDLEKMNSGRPWRMLLLNHGIVATRSHNTDCMESAFALLTSKLPEDATRFFSEGMHQMEALDYPPRVRKIMEKYHREWPVHRSLH
jgi:uncharacterized phage infection (PIP) family protein YhgE